MELTSHFLSASILVVTLLALSLGAGSYLGYKVRSHRRTRRAVNPGHLHDEIFFRRFLLPGVPDVAGPDEPVEADALAGAGLVARHDWLVFPDILVGPKALSCAEVLPDADVLERAVEAETDAAPILSTHSNGKRRRDGKGSAHARVAWRPFLLTLPAVLPPLNLPGSGRFRTAALVILAMVLGVGVWQGLASPPSRRMTAQLAWIVRNGISGSVRGGREASARADEGGAVLKPFGMLAPTRVLLRTSSADSLVLTREGADYAAMVADVEGTLRALGLAPVRMRGLPASSSGVEVPQVPVSAMDVGSASSSPRDLLVLPQASCFTKEEWNAVLRYLEQGGSVMAIGALGTRDEDGEPLGPARLLDLVGAQAVRPLAAEYTDFITLGQQVPPTGTWTQGLRLAMRRIPDALGAEVEMPLAYWSNYARDGVPNPARPLAAAAAVPRGYGRLLWFGMSRLAFHEDAANRSMALAWLGDALRWCVGVAGAELAPWPEGAEAAVLLAEDTEDRFENAASFLEALDRRGLPGTFLCVSDLARHHPQLMRRIAERHEVGSHGDDHRELKGLPLEEQKRHVAASARVLSDLTGRPVLGFRPPGEGFDQATLEALAAAGYRYLLAGGHPRALPEVLAVKAPGGASTPIVRIGRTAPDDYDVVVTRKVSPDDAVLEFERGLERVRVFEGVDLVSVHTQILGRPEAIGALELFLDGLHHQRVWVTTAGNLAAWWLQRSGCETTIEPAEDGAFHLRVANTGDEELSKLLVRFCLPANPARVTYRLLSGSSSPFMSGPVGTSVQLEPDWRGTFALALHPVPAHSEIHYQIQITDRRAQGDLSMMVPKTDITAGRTIARRRETNTSRLSTWSWTCSRLPAGIAGRFDPEIPRPLNAGMAGRFDDHGPGLNLLDLMREGATKLERELR